MAFIITSPPPLKACFISFAVYHSSPKVLCLRLWHRLISVLCLHFVVMLYYYYFWPCLMACGILVPWPGTESPPTTVEAQSPNHWITREFLVVMLYSYLCLLGLYIPHITCCCSVTQLYLTLCDPMNCSTPGFPVLHYLLEFVQTHVHWVDNAIQPSHPLSSPSTFLFCA